MCDSQTADRIPAHIPALSEGFSHSKDLDLGNTDQMTVNFYPNVWRPLGRVTIRILCK